MQDEIFEEIYKFNGLKDWQHQIIEAGKKFYEKYNVQPEFIRIKDETLDLLLEEAEKKFFNPLNSEHSILNQEGVEIVPYRRDAFDPNSEARTAEGFTTGREDFEDNQDEFSIRVYSMDDDEDEIDYEDDEIELDDEFYEVYEFDYGEEDDDEIEFDTNPFSPVILESFGFEEDGRISLGTSKYKLYFLEGDDLTEDSFALNYGDNPDSEEEGEN